MSRTLADLPPGGRGVLEEIRLPTDDAERLMTLGFIPGARIEVTRSAPGGDPVVYLVDGAAVAIRRETARCLVIRHEP